MAPPTPIERATEVDVWLAPAVAKDCEACGKRIHLREMVGGAGWIALDRVAINRIHEHNGRLLGAVLVEERHRCEPKGQK